ncbi:MAG: hypothetical protein IT233_04735 [Bacteroidia bacterium]|nr:hypothetical protein [Bacteroidia bacterium]
MTRLEDELLDLEPGESLEKGRPSFLTGLCILSWAGCAFSFLTGAWALIQVMELGGVGALMPAYYILFQVLTLTLIILCAAGVFGMWKLKRWGFFVYLIGEFGPVTINVITVVSQLQGLDTGFNSMLFSFSGITSLIIPVVFSVLYGINFRHLR